MSWCLDEEKNIKIYYIFIRVKFRAPPKMDTFVWSRATHDARIRNLNVVVNWEYPIVSDETNRKFTKTKFVYANRIASPSHCWIGLKFAHNALGNFPIFVHHSHDVIHLFPVHWAEKSSSIDDDHDDDVDWSIQVKWPNIRISKHTQNSMKTFQ